MLSTVRVGHNCQRPRVGPVPHAAAPAQPGTVAGPTLRLLEGTGHEGGGRGLGTGLPLWSGAGTHGP